ncbi:MAG TPA: hypothetical protein VFH43_09640, partial [Candidatus Kapabacteria bacterium]|nr:hypothetical protein [Candidatus Kapabacteria bacterium]
PSTTQFAPLIASLGMTCCIIVLLLGISINESFAQRRDPVEYYRSKYGWALQADPLGYVLGRYGGRLEKRTDPNFSFLLDYSFDRDIDSLKSSITDDKIPTHSAGVGARIYLKDNNAVEGLFAGLTLAGTIQSGTRLGLRLSAEIGYKWMLGDGPFFIEPQFIVDSYVFRDPAAKPMFAYVSLPLGFAWK